MRQETIGLLQNDLKAFARKALRKLDDTVIDDDRYIELVRHVPNEVRRRVDQATFVNMPPRHAKIEIWLHLLHGLDFGAQSRGENHDRDVLQRSCRKYFAIAFETYWKAAGSKRCSPRASQKDIEDRAILQPQREAKFTPRRLTGASPGSAGTPSSSMTPTTFPM